MGEEAGKVRRGHERTAAGLACWGTRRSATCLRTQVGTVSKGARVQGMAGVALVGRGRKRTVLALLPRQGREAVSVMQGDNRVRLARVWRGLGRTSTALSKPAHITRDKGESRAGAGRPTRRAVQVEAGGAHPSAPSAKPKREAKARHTTRVRQEGSGRWGWGCMGARCASECLGDAIPVRGESKGKAWACSKYKKPAGFDSWQLTA